MTIKTTRREFMKVAGAAGAVTAFAVTGCASGPSGSGPRVVVVGGGFGGATAARYVKKFGPDFRVTMIEPKSSYVTCPFSNAYLGGIVDLATITHNYDGISAMGVDVVQDRVTGLDANAKTVTLSSGAVIEYDRLIVSPGIDFKWTIPGYDETSSELAPHAWQAGGQTVTLRKQLEEMDDGGTVIIAPPGNPFRCPPGPYERAAMIAHYLKTNKPKSKVLILDRKDKFSKQGAFMEGWKKHYANYIEWVPATEVGTITNIDVNTKTLATEMDTHKADVLNFIPNQKAGAIAHTMGLTDGDWCPVDLLTFESKVIPGVHVIGDAAVVTGMPKSGNAANSEAKICASAVVQLLSGATEVASAISSNTCYSLVTPDYGISVTAVWQGTAEKYAKTSGGVSPADQSDGFRANEAKYAHGWYANITADVFG